MTEHCGSESCNVPAHFVVRPGRCSCTCEDCISRRAFEEGVRQMGAKVLHMGGVPDSFQIRRIENLMAEEFGVAP